MRGPLETLQVNLGDRCNLSCIHCHVNAGPKRKEMMSLETIDHVLAFLSDAGIQPLDLTGGAPEVNPRFWSLVRSARELGVQSTGGAAATCKKDWKSPTRPICSIIAGALQDNTFLQAVVDVDFAAVSIDKWGAEPWQVVEGIEFRVVTIAVETGRPWKVGWRALSARQ